MTWGTNFRSLLERHRGGDPDALEQLMTAGRPIVVAAARRFLRSHADVEDAIQETWMVLVCHQDRIEQPECLPAWLRTTTTNIARRMSKRSSRFTTLDDNGSVNGHERQASNECERAALNGERSIAVHCALDSLANDDRQLLMLLTDERELPYQVIGSMVNRPVGSLGPTRQRLIGKLRRHPAIERLVEEPIPA
jgi:RNA polymerase sigma factor (sigma-70 family)